MSYNGFGNMTGVSVGSRNLASYTYGSANGLMTEMSYGNGASVSYEYDVLERVSEIYYNGYQNKQKGASREHGLYGAKIIRPV